MGTRLNLPEHKLVFFNMGLYKPISAFWHYDTGVEAKVIIIQDMNSIHQTLGQNMRMTQSEKNEDKPSRRVAILMGVYNYRGFLPYLVIQAKESFKNIGVILLKNLEQ